MDDADFMCMSCRGYVDDADVMRMSCRGYVDGAGFMCMLSGGYVDDVDPQCGIFALDKSAYPVTFPISDRLTQCI